MDVQQQPAVDAPQPQPGALDRLVTLRLVLAACVLTAGCAVGVSALTLPGG